MKRGRPSGWQLQNRKMQVHAVMPSGASRWERLLYSLGLEEKDVKHLRGPQRDKVIQFAQKHHDHYYVPSWLLEDLSIHSSRYDI